MELKKLREKLGISQTEVANKLKINSQTYNRYETGVNQPNIEMLIKLADFFNVSIDDLIGRKSETINLNFYNDNKKELLKYLIQEDDKTIERVYDFYKGLKYEKWNKVYNQQLFNTFQNTSNPLNNSQNNFIYSNPHNFNNSFTINSPTREMIEDLKNDPFFKDKTKDENK